MALWGCTQRIFTNEIKYILYFSFRKNIGKDILLKEKKKGENTPLKKHPIDTLS